MTLETALALALTKALTLAQSLAQVIEAMVEHATTLQGLVLSLYGTGNGPSHKARFLTTIHKAIQRGIVVVAASQCQRGTVDLDAYEVGRRLLELGVVSAGVRVGEPGCKNGHDSSCGCASCGARSWFWPVLPLQCAPFTCVWRADRK